MSSISSIGSNPDLVQMVQQAQSQGAAQQASSQPSTQSQFEAKAQAAGIDINGLKSLHGEMQSAVQDALKSADPSANRQTTVQNAIDGVLKEHGYDPAKLKSQFEAAGLKAPGQYSASGKVSGQKHGGHHHHGQTQSVQQGQTAQPSVDADGDHDGSAAIAGVLQQASAGSLVDVAA